MVEAFFSIYDIKYRNYKGTHVLRVVSRNSLTGAESLLIEKLDSTKTLDGRKDSEGLEIISLEKPKIKEEDLKKYNQEGVFQIEDN